MNRLHTFRADDREFEILRQVAAARGLSVSATIRLLAAEEAQRLGLVDAPTTPKPKRKPKYEPRIWRGDEIYNMEFPQRKPRSKGGEQ